MPDLRKLTDEDLVRLIERVGPSWQGHHSTQEQRWIRAEAERRGISADSVLEAAFERLGKGPGADSG